MYWRSSRLPTVALQSLFEGDILDNAMEMAFDVWAGNGNDDGAYYEP